MTRLTCWYGDHGVCDLFTQICLGDFLHLRQDHGADFFGSLSSCEKSCKNQRKGALLTKSRSRPLCWTVMYGLPPFSVTLNGQCFMSFLISSSSIRRPINRLASNTVFVGLEWKAFFALSPTLKGSVNHSRDISQSAYSRSVSVKLTHEGVIRFPWSLAMISTLPRFCTLEKTKRYYRKMKMGTYPTQEYLDRELLVSNHGFNKA